MPSNPPEIKPRKKKRPRAKVGPTTARTEASRGIAFEMLRAGHKCPAIGEALGVSRVRAWVLAKEGLAELRSETLDQAEDWRTFLTSVHLEQLHYGIKLRDGDPEAQVDSETRRGDVKGVDIVDKAASQLKSLWVPPLTTSVKAEVTGANGGPLTLARAPDLTQLTDTQLAQLETILASVVPAPEAPITPAIPG